MKTLISEGKVMAISSKSAIISSKCLPTTPTHRLTRLGGFDLLISGPDGWSQEANLRSELDSELATESSLGRESVTAAAADFALPFSMKMDGGDDAREREGDREVGEIQ